MTTERESARQRRHRRVRKRLEGTPERPRLAVYRSSRHIYAQVIDDTAGRTLAAASTLTLSGNGGGGAPKDRARAVGRAVAEAAKAAGVKSVRFDRGGFTYHGRIQALADGAREAGLEF